jgi:paraquat-inducible protein B
MLLGFVTLFSFGGVNFFSKPERFIVYFNESIHGLDNGSPVKLRGVRIGRVVAMNVRAIPAAPGSDEPRSVVAVICELSRDVVADGQGRPVDVSDREELQRLIDEGLRARLGVIGLATGLLYVELDFYDPQRFPAFASLGVDSSYIEMPAIKSAYSEFQANLTEILNDFKRVDVSAMAEDLRGLLADTRRQINAADLAAVSREWAEAGRSIRTLADSPETRAMVANAASAAARLDGMLAELEKNVGPGSEEFALVLKDARGSINQFNELAVVMKRFVNAQQHLGDDATKALTRLGEASSAVARLADFLERNPSALISGRATEK